MLWDIFVYLVIFLGGFILALWMVAYGFLTSPKRGWVSFGKRKIDIK